MMTRRNKTLATTNKSLALIGVDEVEYWPTVLASAEGAHQLTNAVVALAFHALEQERKGGSELPDVEVANPGTGEIGMNPAYELMLRERALVYLQTMGTESEASKFEILAEIEARQLYVWGEEPWESLAQFVRSLGEGRSPTYASVWERMAARVLPALQVEKTVGVQQIMDIIVEGKKSNLYHLLPNMLAVIDDTEMDQQAKDNQMSEMLTDAKNLERGELWAKYKDGETVPPAKAVLTYTNPGWQLVITMSEAQKRIVLNRLGQRVKY